MKIFFELLKNLCISLLIGFVISLGTFLPILSMLIALAAWPIINIPGFSETGKYVEYGHFWITLKSIESWILFTVYYAILPFIILIIIMLIKKIIGKK